MKVELTQDIVRELLDYNPDTGVLTWKKRDLKWFKSYRSYCSWNAKHSGNVVGIVHKGSRGKSYVCIKIQGSTCKAHRLVFLHMEGSTPVEVDHINGDGTDNRWCNLREADRIENGVNKRIASNNTSGVTGVGWNTSSCKWQSYIKVKQKQIYLGKFSDFFEAVCVRKSAENYYNFHKNHGSVRPL